MCAETAPTFMATRLGVVGAAAYVSRRAVARASKAASAARREEPTGRRGSRTREEEPPREEGSFPRRDVFRARRLRAKDEAFSSFDDATEALFRNFRNSSPEVPPGTRFSFSFAEDAPLSPLLLSSPKTSRRGEGVGKSETSNAEFAAATKPSEVDERPNAKKASSAVCAATTFLSAANVRRLARVRLPATASARHEVSARLVTPNAQCPSALRCFSRTVRYQVRIRARSRLRSAIARSALRRRASATTSRSAARVSLDFLCATPYQACTHRPSVNTRVRSTFASTVSRTCLASKLESAQTAKSFANRRRSAFFANRSAFFARSVPTIFSRAATEASRRQASNAVCVFFINTPVTARSASVAMPRRSAVRHRQARSALSPDAKRASAKNAAARLSLNASVSAFRRAAARHLRPAARTSLVVLACDRH
mmetsp:Transcript_4718/g.20074  ORF Transcript_4718/g.20074 Transcript_4718/m.20074 type:complete len:427 (+) Transcript_4718:384-1664(+)